MPSTASHVGRLQHRHDVERDLQEDDFAVEQQQTRAKEDQKRQELISKAKERAAKPAPSGGRQAIIIPDEESYAESRSATVQALQHKQDGKRKSLRERQAKEIEAVRKKGPTPGKHVAPREPEPHHGISTIWASLDSARKQAVRGVMEKYARLHDDSDSDVLDLNKSQAMGRYGKPGTRTADDADRQHEEAHRKIAKDEYDRLRVLWAQFEGELEQERRMIHDHAIQRGALAKQQYEESMARRR
jgi:hypothetical protein